MSPGLVVGVLPIAAVKAEVVAAERPAFHTLVLREHGDAFGLFFVGFDGFLVHGDGHVREAEDLLEFEGLGRGAVRDEEIGCRAALRGHGDVRLGVYAAE